MAVLPIFTAQLDAVQTGQQGHYHLFNANNIERVFTTYRDAIFVDSVMDNTSAKKKACGVHKDSFPSHFFQGCESDGLLLLVNDIFWASMKVKSSGTELTYPEDYPC